MQTTSSDWELGGLTKSGLKLKSEPHEDYAQICPGNWLQVNPTENLMGSDKRKKGDTKPNDADKLKASIKASWTSITPLQWHKLIGSMPHPIDAVIRAKGASTKYWVHKWTDVSEDQHLYIINPFLLVFCKVLRISWDTGFGIFMSPNP